MNMGNLRFRVKFNTTLNVELMKELRELSAKTGVPISRLVEEAVKDLMVKRKDKG